MKGSTLETIVTCLLPALTITFLVYSAVCDLKTKTIRTIPTAIFLAASVLLRLIGGNFTLPAFIASLVPGGVLFLCSLLTKESIGRGDALIVLACGAALGIPLELYSLFMAFLFGGLFSLVWLLRHKCSKKDSFAFVPYLLAGHIAALVLS